MAQFDAIVVGAGPAGSAAAYTMARGGLSVALIERGKKPGSKNMFGGTIYRRPTEEVFRGFWEYAPIERPVVTEQLWLMDTDSAVQIGFTGLRFAKPPYNTFTVSRPKFDNWLAQQAVKAGAKLYTDTLVTDLLYEKKLFTRGKVKGVLVEKGDRITADAVILTEGAPSVLTKKAGLRSGLPPSTFTLYVREVLELDSAIIEERFQLGKGQGAVYGLFGWPLAGAIGKGGIWTLKDSLSLVIGTFLDQMVKKKLSPYDMLQRAKEHPLVKNLLSGSKRVEYQAHLIPKGGYRYIPELYDDGVLVAGDAATMVSARQGTDLAMLSGKYAGEAVIQAKAKEDFSARALGEYQRRLNNSYFMKDIKAKKNAVNDYIRNPDADLQTAKVMNDAFYQLFTIGMESAAEKKKKITEEMVHWQSPLLTLNDVMTAVENWGIL